MTALQWFGDILVRWPLPSAAVLFLVVFSLAWWGAGSKQPRRYDP